MRVPHSVVLLNFALFQTSYAQVAGGFLETLPICWQSCLRSAFPSCPNQEASDLAAACMHRASLLYEKLAKLVFYLQAFVKMLPPTRPHSPPLSRALPFSATAITPHGSGLGRPLVIPSAIHSQAKRCKPHKIYSWWQLQILLGKER